jgi:hypothetical protein
MDPAERWDGRNRLQPLLRLQGNRTQLTVLVSVALAFAIGVLVFAMLLDR